MTLSSIRELIQTELKATDEYIITCLESNIPMVREMLEYVLTCGGKRIRPMILLLAAKALDCQHDQHISLAAVIELIHTATLLHDDVVDDSTLRRNHQTPNIIWGNDASVLVGDFLYSRAFQIVVDLNRYDILSIFAKATHYIAEGEILQMINCRKSDTDETFYYDIIKRKTGKLFEIATQLGAMLVTDNQQEIEALRIYGAELGIAYQLIDDALDYQQNSENTGKNVGQDIAEGKMTLPLIYAMQQCNESDKEIIHNAITTATIDKLYDIMRIIETTHAIKYTADAAKKHATIAKQALNIIKPSKYRDALIAISDFVVERNF